MLQRARVVANADTLGRSVPAGAGEVPSEPARGVGTDKGARARIVPRAVADAHVAAAALLARARNEAKEILAHARAAADDLVVEQQARARADALCLVVGEALELRKRQAELSKSVLDRSVGFATVLAERLLGEELQLNAERVRALARQALKEAAGARHALIIAHPRDAAELRANLASLGDLLDSIGIEEDAGLGRGQLRVETELGVIEADLKGQLQRLAAQLKKLLELHGGESF
ncbi:MAG TPA: FliH/SctL family protein [Polyangiaceae bacterium]|nr:FliH/SctL family protein [Polyangiaceae bacterium]